MCDSEVKSHECSIGRPCFNLSCATPTVKERAQSGQFRNKVEVLKLAKSNWLLGFVPDPRDCNRATSFHHELFPNCFILLKAGVFEVFYELGQDTLLWGN